MRIFIRSLCSASTISALCLILLVAATVHRVIFVGPSADFDVHDKLIPIPWDWHHVPVSYFLYHLSVSLIATWFRIDDVRVAAFCAALVWYGLFAIAIERTLTLSLAGSHVQLSAPARILVTLCIAIAAPISLLTYPHLVFPYFAMNVYHNPTILAAKPFSVPLIALCVGTAFRFGRPAFAYAAALALMVTFSGLGKPTYILELIPALLIWVMFVRWRTKSAFLMLTAVVAPAMVVLLSSLYWYRSIGQSNVFRFSMFGSYTMFWNIHFLPIGIVASLAFPIAVAVLFFEQVAKDDTSILAWITMLVGILARLTMADQNFGWGTNLAVLTLFVTATVLVLRRWTLHLRPDKLRLRACFAVMGLHVGCGVLLLCLPGSW
jgi:hypothetical protein